MDRIKEFWDKNSKRIFLIILGVIGVLFLFGCANTSGQDGTAPSESLDASVTQTAVARSADTVPEPTNIPMATATETNIPLPTATMTPLPEPVVLTGTGNSVVNLDKWNGPALLKVTHTGGGNFIVKNFDELGKQINLLVFTSGSYDGFLPLDFLDSEQTKTFDITANGSWELQIIPLGAIRVENIPTTVSGTGDDMFVLKGDGSPDMLKVDASQASQNFVVYGIGNQSETLVDETAPYTGMVTISNDPRVLVVKATGPWSLDVAVK